MEYPADNIPHEEPALSKRQSRLWLFIPAVILFGVFSLLVIKSPASFPTEGTIFTIVAGEPLIQVGTELKSESYISSRFLFVTAVTFFGGEHKISPGDYYFPKGSTLIGIAHAIATGHHNLDPIKITIPEGENAREIGTLLSEKLPKIQASEFTTQAKKFEGYLFPQTYFMYPSTVSTDAIKQMRSMFDSETATLFTPVALGVRTKEQVVVMASLIEREASGNDDRATIAGILWKRLALGMPLQVDATVAYANGVPENSLAKSDFSIDSLYNTYIYKGLPPGPISNPGLQALRGALDPKETPYLYYLHDKHGSIHYAKTYAEHLANIKNYLK